MIRNIATGALYGAVTDQNGNWAIANVAAGRLQITPMVVGFKTMTRQVAHDASRGTRVNLALEVGTATEAVTVTAETPLLKTEMADLQSNVSADNLRSLPILPQVVPLPASANVQDLQRRVAGVLPIAVNVPRMGSSYQFVRPLVIDEATTLTFKYRMR